MTSDEAMIEQQGGGLGNELDCPESVRSATKKTRDNINPNKAWRLYSSASVNSYIYINDQFFV